MYKKLMGFYQKHRITILRINDFFLGILIILQSILPENKIRSILGAILTIFYGGSTARYYRSKRN